MATNLALDDTGDIAIASDGTQRWTASLAEEVAQRLESKYGLWLGEWFLDIREGVPYYRDILVRNPNMTVVRSVLRKVATDDPGVDDVPVFEVALDSRTRQLSVSFSATLISGEVITLNPFLI